MCFTQTLVRACTNINPSISPSMCKILAQINLGGSSVLLNNIENYSIFFSLGMELPQDWVTKGQFQGLKVSHNGFWSNGQNGRKVSI